jgi:hypothetical protein
MAMFNELLEHSDQQHAQKLDDIKVWREVAKARLKERQACAEKLGSETAPNEKPPLYLYGMF